MQGIALSRRFHAELVRPWLERAAPGLAHAAALIGYGSELLGFDDETSKDHNWGPRVQLFVSAEAFAAQAERLVGAFAAEAPAEFLGEPIGYRSRPHPPVTAPGRLGDAAHGLEILTLEAALEDLLGIADTRQVSALQWLCFAEQRLLAFTAGAVFHDDGGRLAAAREALAYFPRDVWLYKIACQWQRVAEEQAFVGRTGQVGDELGSRIVASRLAGDAMRLAFLLERRYAPYAKWFGRAFATLPIATELGPLLQRALAATAWQERGECLAASYLVLARRQQRMGIAADARPTVGPYHERPFATINADALVAASLGQIEDAAVAALPVVGALDQLTDLTAVLVDPKRSQRVARAALERTPAARPA